MLKHSYNHSGLDQNGKTIVEYVWIGGYGDDLRSKSKTYDKPINSIDDLGEWNYDGSSTHQAETNNSEVLIRPIALFDDPFNLKPNKICLCETFYSDGTPTNTNFRHFAKKIFDLDSENKFDPWFGIEQEYALMITLGADLTWPYGWPVGSYPTAQGRYYCSTGYKNSYARDIAIAHYKACLYAGVKVFGTNCESLPGQWEFQVGNCKGIEIGDHLWMGRFLLERVAEIRGVDVNFEPKPVPGDWAGSGGHINYSDNKTRNDTNLVEINKQLQFLEKNHHRMIKVYGKDNHLRLTGIFLIFLISFQCFFTFFINLGEHETSAFKKFTVGVADRESSIRVPKTTKDVGKGYYEDRRPAANLDPYVVSASIFSANCFDLQGFDELEKHYLKFLKQN
jgi:glutamine synthetase